MRVFFKIDGSYKEYRYLAECRLVTHDESSCHVTNAIGRWTHEAGGGYSFRMDTTRLTEPEFNVAINQRDYFEIYNGKTSYYDPERLGFDNTDHEALIEGMAHTYRNGFDRRTAHLKMELGRYLKGVRYAVYSALVHSNAEASVIDADAAAPADFRVARCLDSSGCVGRLIEGEYYKVARFEGLEYMVVEDNKGEELMAAKGRFEAATWYSKI